MLVVHCVYGCTFVCYRGKQLVLVVHCVYGCTFVCYRGKQLVLVVHCVYGCTFVCYRGKQNNTLHVIFNIFTHTKNY